MTTFLYNNPFLYGAILGAVFGTIGIIIGYRAGYHRGRRYNDFYHSDDCFNGWYIGDTDNDAPKEAKP